VLLLLSSASYSKNPMADISEKLGKWPIKILDSTEVQEVQDKRIYPGLIDSTVEGGLPTDKQGIEYLVRESAEKPFPWREPCSLRSESLRNR